MIYAKPLALAVAAPCLCSIVPRSHPKSRGPTSVRVNLLPPDDGGIPLEHFVSYSIEFSSFPDFAGNLSSPNVFSSNLLDNIGNFTGTKPLVRVGGNTQDFALFDKNQSEALVGVYNTNISNDYPTNITIGPAYFESYQTFPGVKYVHGFNLGLNSTTERQGLIDSVSYACKALGDKLLDWELGNEPDLFKTAPARRPISWDEQDYVNEWLNWTTAIHKALGDACPSFATSSRYRYYAPSFAGAGPTSLGPNASNYLDPIKAWNSGLVNSSLVSHVSAHNYISGAETPGVTLQGTLMNHTSTIDSVSELLNYSRALQNPRSLPFILGETNSLFRQGRPGLSNTFGAALWGVDFNLWCASNNISRVHMHQGTNYRYQSWQPVDTEKATKGTKAPYYGNVGVAAFLGDLSDPEDIPRIVNLPLEREEEAAYAAYVGDTLERIVVINLMAWNATDYNGEYLSEGERPVEAYLLQAPKSVDGVVRLRRLMANGSDAISGVTFDGYSYNFELDGGKPVLLGNVTRGESVVVGEGGWLEVEVPWSSAVIVDVGK